MNNLHRTIFSPCRKYRYTLHRRVGFMFDSAGTGAFVGLNPSTADEHIDDPTIRRCVAFARDWGYRDLLMLNLFAFRATKPKDMLAAADPIGPQNDETLRLVASEAQLVVAAWGAHGSHLEREAAVCKMLPTMHALRLTKDGHPAHPLYLPKTLRPVLWPRFETA